MRYLADHPEQRMDPRRAFPGSKIIICVALNYFTADLPSAGKLGIARYARGRDYHTVMRARLDLLISRLRQMTNAPDAWFRAVVDSSPIMEKLHAARAGLGWIGKNSLLINERYGSWLVLGEIITNLELQPDEPVADRCGDCRRCLEGCPTGALVAPHRLDARNCLSFWTIESREAIPPILHKCLSDRLFGCDACQEACPWNSPGIPTAHPEFRPDPGRKLPNLNELLHLSSAEIKKICAGTSLARAKPQHLRQIAQIIMNDI